MALTAILRLGCHRRDWLRDHRYEAINIKFHGIAYRNLTALSRWLLVEIIFYSQGSNTDPVRMQGETP
jgi:hypothetical protein